MSENRSTDRPSLQLFKVRVSEEAIARATKVLRSGCIGEGPVVAELEASFARVSGSNFNVAVNSGTSALHLAVILAGVEQGDEVITSAQTMMATAHAVLMERAKPVFADIQPRTGNLDPTDVRRRITPRTRAILAVHWAGYPCDPDELHAIAREHDLAVIEDAAHAIGATYHGSAIGSVSDFTCFSFQAIKHVTSGDGGMLCLRDEPQRRIAARLRWFGIDRQMRKPNPLGEPEWNVSRLGYKYHMNDIAAAIAIGNLPMLDEDLRRRRAIARAYRQGLAGVPGLSLLDVANDRASACWLFTVLVERRLDFAMRMREKGIEVSVVHLRIDRNDLYGGLRHDLPNLDEFTEKHISLPIHSELSDDDVEYIVSNVREGW